MLKSKQYFTLIAIYFLLTTYLGFCEESDETYEPNPNNPSYSMGSVTINNIKTLGEKSDLIISETTLNLCVNDNERVFLESAITLNNRATLNVSNNNQDKKIYLLAPFTINGGGLLNLSGSYVFNEDTFLINFGGCLANSLSYFSNQPQGTIINKSLFINQATGHLVNQEGATFTNQGRAENQENSKLLNSGKFFNVSGGVFNNAENFINSLTGVCNNDNQSTFSNSKLFVNEGCFQNEGIFRNTGTIENYGNYINEGNFVTNSYVGLIINYRTFTNSGMGIIQNTAIQNDGILNFEQIYNLSFSGNISGNGSVYQKGSGSTTLNGINTYNGRTEIQSGELILKDSQAAGTGIIVNNSILTLDFFNGNFYNQISGTGDIYLRNNTIELLGDRTLFSGRIIRQDQ